MSIRRLFATAGAAALCLALAHLAFAPTPALAAEEGAASPEEVVKALQAASDTEDFAKLVSLIHPEDRPEMAAGMMMAGSMAAAFSDDAEAAGKELEAVLSKHGLEDKADGPPPGAEGDMKAAAKAAFEGVDLVAFIPDMFTFMGKYMDGKKKGPLAGGEMTDLEVEGDTATAKAGDEKVRFGKVGDRWFIRME